MSMSDADLAQAELDETRWAVPQMIPEGLTLFCGPPKVRKSFAVLDAAESIANDQKWLGAFACEPGEVLYLGLEDNESRLKARTGAWFRAHPGCEPQGRCHFETEWSDAASGGLADLEAYLDDFQNTRLVVIDTLDKIQPVAHSYNASRPTIGRLSTLGRKHHTAIVGVHHMYRTGSRNRPIWERVQGSIGAFAAADAAFALIRNQDTGQLQLHQTGKDVIETSFVLIEENGILRADLQAAMDVEATTESRSDVIRAIQVNPGSDARTLAAFLERETNNVRQQLHHMAQSGEVQRQNGLYWTWPQWKALADDANPQLSLTRQIEKETPQDPIQAWLLQDRSARGIETRRTRSEP
jgi:RecA-family ATPase